VAAQCTKGVISLKRGKIERKLLMIAYIKSYTRYRFLLIHLTLNDFHARFNVFFLWQTFVKFRLLILSLRPCHLPLKYQMKQTKLLAQFCIDPNLQRHRAVCLRQHCFLVEVSGGATELRRPSQADLFWAFSSVFHVKLFSSMLNFNAVLV